MERLLLAVRLLVVFGGLLGGCVPPSLEIDPQSDLGQGLVALERGNHAAARQSLERAVAADPGDARTRIGLAAALERIGRLDSALAVLNAIDLETASSRARGEVDARRRVIARRRLEFLARSAVAAEDSLTATPPEPNSLAVLPFQYLGVDERLRPLERGVAHLLVTVPPDREQRGWWLWSTVNRRTR
ncbi:MAG: tetratricopeptide repeat protein [Gemmatimonadales bacterium]